MESYTSFASVYDIFIDNITYEEWSEYVRDILYLLQDIREIELYGTVRAVISICDSLNYITEEAELEEVFMLVNNYADVPAGNTEVPSEEQSVEKNEAACGEGAGKEEK